MKISLSNLHRILNDLDSRELDVYLYLVKRQNEFGQVRHIYYKDVMNDLNIPRSTLYYVVDQLKEKNLVKDNSDRWGTYHLILTDNIFVNSTDYSKGYVNINLDFICSPSFVALNVNVKKFILRMLNIPENQNGSIKLSKDKLKEYKVYALLDVLKGLYDVKIVGDIYYFKSTKLLRKKSTNDKFLRMKHELVSHCRRVAVLVTDEKVLKDATKLLCIHRFNPFLGKALDTIKQTGSVEPKLMNFILSKKVGYSM